MRTQVTKYLLIHTLVTQNCNNYSGLVSLVICLTWLYDLMLNASLSITLRRQVLQVLTNDPVWRWRGGLA